MRLLALLMTFLLSAPATADKITWRTDYRRAVAEAKRTDRLLFVYFSNPG